MGSGHLSSCRQNSVTEVGRRWTVVTCPPVDRTVLQRWVGDGQRSPVLLSTEQCYTGGQEMDSGHLSSCRQNSVTEVGRRWATVTCITGRAVLHRWVGDGQRSPVLPAEQCYRGVQEMGNGHLYYRQSSVTEVGRRWATVTCITGRAVLHRCSGDGQRSPVLPAEQCYTGGQEMGNGHLYYRQSSVTQVGFNWNHKFEDLRPTFSFETLSLCVIDSLV